MANMYFTETAKFKPFSYQEMLAPIASYQEAYNKADEQLNTLLENAALNESSFLAQDTEEKAKFNNLMEQLRTASDALNSGDTQAFKTIRDINKAYRQTMLPIQQKIKKRNELIAEQRKLRETGKNVEFDKDYSSTKLSDITDASTFNPIYVDDIIDKAKKATLEHVSSQTDKTVGNPKQIKGTNSYSILTGRGYTPEEYIEAMNNPNSELKHFRDVQIEKALAGIPENNTSLRERITNSVDNTIKNNIGQFKLNTVSGTKSTYDVNDAFKYVYDEKGRPISYSEEYIEGQLRLKGYQQDENGNYTIPPAHLNPDGTFKTPAQTFVEEHRLYTSPVYIETDNLRNGLIPEEDRRAFVRNWKEIEKGSEIKHIMETTVPITKTIDKKPVTMYPIDFNALPEHSRLRDLINNTVGFNDVGFYKYGYDKENHKLVIIPIDYDVEKRKSTDVKVGNTTPAPTPQPTPTPEVPKKPDTSNS